MYWFGVLFASIGAGAILFALTFVSLLIGVVVNAMAVLIAGPVVDRLLARRGASLSPGPDAARRRPA